MIWSNHGKREDLSMFIDGGKEAESKNEYERKMERDDSKTYKREDMSRGRGVPGVLAEW